MQQEKEGGPTEKIKQKLDHLNTTYVSKFSGPGGLALEKSDQKLFLEKKK